MVTLSSHRTTATTEHPVVAVARILLHRGDDGGAPVRRNDVGFNGADYRPIKRLVWQIDRARGVASEHQIAAIAARCRKYTRQIGEIGFDAEDVFRDVPPVTIDVAQMRRIGTAFGDVITDDDFEENGPPASPQPPVTMRDVLGPGGVIAQRLPGYEAREPQIVLAERIAAAIADRTTLLAEAGTGTGKSLAYLVPALYARDAGRPLKTIVSTEGKALQDQLAKKDLPFLKATLPVPVDFAVLKGIGNYLCLSKWEEELSAQGLIQGELFGAPRQRSGEPDEFARVRAWVDTLDAESTGDLAEAPLTPSPDLLARITTTSDECVGKDCPQYQRCYAVRAKQRAKLAQVLVVNHTLLTLDLGLRARTEDGVGVLPDRDLVVIDEAHTLEDVATKAFTEEIGQHGLRGLFRSRLARTAALDEQKIAGAVVANDALFADLDRLVGEKGASAIATNPALRVLAEAVSEALRPLARQARSASSLSTHDQATRARLERYADRIQERGDLFQSILAGGVERSHVLYAEREATRKGEPRLILKLAPISVADHLRDALWAKWPTIATSATLTATPLEKGGSSFGFLRDRCGVDEADELVVDSPFDYRAHARIYLPEPGFEFDPSRYYGRDDQPGYFGRLAETMRALVEASDGRAFLLFTSRRALGEVYDRIAPDLARTYLVLRQGDASPQTLVAEFKASGSAVLFGLRSFWTGVDVQGDALSLVAIDKLPFPAPDEPVYQARCDALVAASGDKWAWFSRLAIPTCAMAFKQGFGRLIRTATDTGVVALLDGRLTSKGYGSSILDALPPAPRVRSVTQVEAFFAVCEREESAA